MAGLIVTGPRGDREIAYCHGSIPIYDAAQVFFSAEFLLSPPHPFTVHWPDEEIEPGVAKVVGLLIKCPPYQRVWRVTGATAGPGNRFLEAVWPD